MSRRRSDATPMLEWAVGGAGALIFCAMLAVLIWAGLNGADRPPAIRVSVDGIARTETGYVLEIEARNEGELTAANVEITARLANGEESAATFDFLPPRSVRRGGFFFAHDPRGADLHISAGGYADP